MRQALNTGLGIDGFFCHSSIMGERKRSVEDRVGPHILCEWRGGQIGEQRGGFVITGEQHL